jgi:His-Xaa-Ser system protein HxsD
MSRASIQFAKLHNKVIVYVRNKDQSKDNLEKLASDFSDCVLDHQVRFLVNKEFKLIREIIVAQAFQPCDDIKDIVNVIKNE